MNLEFLICDLDICIEKAKHYLRKPERKTLFKSMARSYDINLDMLNENFDEHITTQVTKRYNEVLPTMEMFRSQFEEQWNEISITVNNGFKSIFGYELNKTLGVLLWPSAVCPYGHNSFWTCCHENSTFYTTRKIILHEVTHMYWWKEWFKLFKGTEYADDKYPSLSWLISEIVVDCLLKNSPLKQFIDEGDVLSYQRFYKMTINGQNAMEEIDNLRKNNADLQIFMQKMLEYALKNEEIFKQYLV